jgi:hypothetical protein
MPPGKPLINCRPIAVLSQTVAGALPAVVNLNVDSAVVLQILRNPVSVALNFTLTYFLVVEVPGTPA